MSPKTALVLRATGSQGKSVVSHLLKHNWTVHALVTNPSHALALALKDQGAVLFQGTLDDPSAIETALHSCTALFLNQMPDFTGSNSEVHQATSILSLAKAAGVQHIIHATSLALNDEKLLAQVAHLPSAPALIGKKDVENLVRASGIPYTILRPGYFMTNFTEPLVHMMFPDLARGEFAVSYKPETMFPLVDPADVGAFAVKALEEPGRFVGKVVSVAGELRTCEDTIRAIEKVVGKRVRVTYRTEEETRVEVEKGNVFVAGQLMSLNMGGWIDFGEVEGWGVRVTGFEEFLEANREGLVVG